MQRPTSEFSGKARAGEANSLAGCSLPDKTVSQTTGIKSCAARLRTQAPVTVVVGIGGSYLGAKALTEALQ
ncbi:MAG: hypothetical protein MZV63_51875 [Marinilabiliales bacterium]|nr:hypothetical protein [Marinilabiliales bacterium]